MLREVNDWPKVTELLSDRSTILTQVFCLCAVSAAPRLHQLSSSHEHVQKSFGQLFFNSKGAKAITVASQWLVGDYFCKWLLTEESLLCVCVCVFTAQTNTMGSPQQATKAKGYCSSQGHEQFFYSRVIYFHKIHGKLNDIGSSLAFDFFPLHALSPESSSSNLSYPLYYFHRCILIEGTKCKFSKHQH